MSIDINKASREELKKIKGIGNKTADKILEFRKQGGQMNDLSEFQKVSGLRTDYLEDVGADISFGKINVSETLPDINPVIQSGIISPGLEDVTIDPPLIQKPFHFTVNIADVDEDSDSGRNFFSGYKLIVGYRVTNLVFASTNGGNTKDYSRSYDIGANGKIKVNLQSFLGSVILQESFDIKINDPEGDTIHKESFEIKSGDTIDVQVPGLIDNSFVINLKKENNISYKGYTMRVDYRMTKNTGDIEKKREEFSIANRAEFQIKAGPFGEISDIDIRIISDNGLEFIRRQKEWNELTETEGMKLIPIDLPNPKSLNFSAVLEPDEDSELNPYIDYELLASYNLSDSKSGGTSQTVEKTYSIDLNGRSRLELEYYGSVENIEAQVKAPSGEIIASRTFVPREIGDDGEIYIDVDPLELADTKGITTLPERPQKTVGRVIDALGNRNYEGTQVIIFAATAKDPSKEDYYPIQVTQTESKGYFSIDTPDGFYTGAFARVGVEERDSTESGAQDVPVNLEKDEVIEFEDGERNTKTRKFFPANLILVVGEGAEKADEDCNCNDNCGYLDFEDFNRVVDEFSYHSVVRTTEPDIQGYTLEGDEEMTVQEIVNTVSISQDQDDNEFANIPSHFLEKSIRKNVLLKHINNKRGLTFTNLKKAMHESDAQKLKEKVKPQRDVRAKGRRVLDLENAVDWDEDPTIYQATSVAHGHLLQFKQEWVNAGYSIGDLLYSLPLAPGQKKQIVTFDWERRESASKTGAREYEESLYNSLGRDRDINEISKGVLKENMKGGSSASTSSVSGGFGLGFIGSGVGGLLGVAGGTSKSKSSAWQNSSRKTSMQSMQQLRDRTMQSANAVRSQRSTVVTTATQGERFSAETETVANYNHCHSLTIQYFEVVRHLEVHQRLAGVKECLFVPFILSPFDHQKILRWRESISPYIYSNKLQKGFDAIERIENDYEGSDLPEERYADENINYLEGEFTIEFRIKPPHEITSLEDESDLRENLFDFFGWITGATDHLERIIRAEKKERNKLFLRNVAPKIAAAFVEKLEFYAVKESGTDGSESLEKLELDTTLVSRYKNNTGLYISVRQSGDIKGLSRAHVKSITVDKASSIKLNDKTYLSEVIPDNSQIIIQSGSMRYRTSHFSGELFDKSRIMDDLVGYDSIEDDSAGGTGEKVRIATPLNRREMRDPRNKDLEAANELVGHLNDNLEQYHRIIWMTMSKERRFMLLDGIRVTDYSESDKYPRGVVRSVASVVENQVIGIVGNSLVMPVAPGFRLDPNVKGKDVDLLSLYKPQTKPEPTNVAIPTKGVFAEAVMGECNSCEKKQDDRFWRWSEEPIPMDPTSIEEVSTGSRRSEPLDTSNNQFPQPMVNIQNAPEAPDPAGIQAAANLLQSGSFDNITGLEGNQANAIKGLQASMNAAKHFGSEGAKIGLQAKKMSGLSGQLDAIKKAKQNNMLSAEKARQLTEEAIKSQNAGSDALDSGIEKMSKVQKMMDKGDLSKDVGKKVIESIGNGISNSMGGSSENVKDIISSVKDKEGNNPDKLKVKSEHPDGSSSEITTENMVASGPGGSAVPEPVDDPMNSYPYEPLSDIFTVESSAAWLRDPENNFRPLKDEEGNTKEIPEGTEVILASAKNHTGHGWVVKALDKERNELGWTKFSNLNQIDCRTYNPPADQVDKIVIDGNQLDGPSGFSVTNWANSDVHHFVNRTPHCRELDDITEIIIHEPAPLTSYGPEEQQNHDNEDPPLGVHFAIHRDGSIYSNGEDGSITQHNDVTDALNHAEGHNVQGIGIEVVNPVESVSLNSDEWPTIDADWPWGGRTYVLPTKKQMESNTQLIYWLTDELPQIPLEWPGLHKESNDKYYFQMTGNLPGNDSGVRAHGYSGHSDGFLLALYAWLRLSAKGGSGMSVDDAWTNTKSIAKQDLKTLPSNNEIGGLDVTDYVN